MMFEFWLIIAISLIILEIVLSFTIVLFFSSLACLTVAGLIYYQYIPNENLIKQFGAFFMATAIWTLLLWKPLKSTLKKVLNTHDSLINIIGQQAVVTDKMLKVGHVGLVRWSGTLVKARLDPSSNHHTLAIDKEVIITDIIDNIFIVKEIN